MKTILGLFAAMIAIGSFAVAQQTTAKTLYIVTYVDVYPNFAEDAAKLLQQMASDSRKDAGSVRFEVIRDVARANHLAIVEVWQNQKAFDTHVALTRTKEFRTKIQPMLGSPFDERLYNAIQ
jgi:quinol monooxygenase YgiN